jgi:hypothetical protein
VERSLVLGRYLAADHRLRPAGKPRANQQPGAASVELIAG